MIKEDGKMNLQVFCEGGADGAFDDPEEVLRRIISNESSSIRPALSLRSRMERMR